jgi:hypothetical protein
MTVTKEELATKIDAIDWFTLRAHLERGAIIVIDPILELAEVGAGVANDDVKTIERWVSSRLMGKPTAQQIEKWDAEKRKSFLCLIVSPYVLIQEESPEKG